ncbi:MAG TPA: 16S rRNA (uracil(1498)-N(3))-methyltransferase [Streptosporangiaceae bacterium]|nr:16S rRNA (uracil(1498)-N(3))-methyltransferase [Streptosporangiaceae bacterium]
MTAPVFLADDADLTAAIEGALITLTGPEGRHATTVRRIRPGERVDVADGAGLIAECVVTEAGADRVQLRVQARREVPAPDPRIVVVQALPKGDRAELAVETMTEVGVDVIVPFAAERCVARWPAGDRAAKALARWRSASREAAKQARRARIPEVTGLASAAEVSARLKDAARGVILEPGAEVALSRLDLPDHGDIVLVVGPEGGLSPGELDTFTDAGANLVRLGDSVLRASTAGAAAAAVLMTTTGRW